MSLSKTLKRFRAFIVILLLFLIYTKYVQIFLFLIVIIAYRLIRKRKIKVDKYIRISLEHCNKNLEEIRDAMEIIMPDVCQQEYENIQKEVEYWEADLLLFNQEDEVRSPPLSEKGKSKIKIKADLFYKVVIGLGVFLIYVKFPQVLIFFGLFLAYRWWKGNKKSEIVKIGYIQKRTTKLLTQILRMTYVSIDSLQKQVKHIFTRLPQKQDENRDLSRYDYLASDLLTKD